MNQSLKDRLFGARRAATPAPAPAPKPTPTPAPKPAPAPLPEGAAGRVDREALAPEARPALTPTAPQAAGAAPEARPALAPTAPQAALNSPDAAPTDTPTAAMVQECADFVRALDAAVGHTTDEQIGDVLDRQGLGREYLEQVKAVARSGADATPPEGVGPAGAVNPPESAGRAGEGLSTADAENLAAAERLRELARVDVMSRAAVKAAVGTVLGQSRPRTKRIEAILDIVEAKGWGKRYGETLVGVRDVDPSGQRQLGSARADGARDNRGRADGARDNRGRADGARVNPSARDNPGTRGDQGRTPG